LLGTLGIPFPDALATSTFTVSQGQFIRTGALFNLPAVLIIAGVGTLCYVGIRQSAFANTIIVAIKVSVILLFLAFGMQYIDTSNWVPFIPENEGPGRFGFDGVVRAAAIVFFAYIGFDAVSTT